MPAQKGRKVLVQSNDGSSPASYTTIGGMRSKTITVNNELVDITDDENAPWRHLLAVTISGSGIFKDDATMNRIEDLGLQGGIDDFRILFENGDSFEGLFQVTSYEYGGEHNGEQTFSITLESAAEIRHVRA